MSHAEVHCLRHCHMRRCTASATVTCGGALPPPLSHAEVHCLRRCHMRRCTASATVTCGGALPPPLSHEAITLIFPANSLHHTVSQAISGAVIARRSPIGTGRPLPEGSPRRRSSGCHQTAPVAVTKLQRLSPHSLVPPLTAGTAAAVLHSIQVVLVLRRTHGGSTTHS